jgi:hypothetical protein
MHSFILSILKAFVFVFFFLFASLSICQQDRKTSSKQTDKQTQREKITPPEKLRFTLHQAHPFD